MNFNQHIRSVPGVPFHKRRAAERMALQMRLSGKRARVCVFVAVEANTEFVTAVMRAHTPWRCITVACYKSTHSSENFFSYATFNVNDDASVGAGSLFDVSHNG